MGARLGSVWDRAVDGGLVVDGSNIAMSVLMLMAVGVVLGWLVVLALSWLNWVPTDFVIRRRVPGLRTVFSPRFVIEPFATAGSDAGLGRSVASLVTDEISQAGPSTGALTRVTGDQTAGVSDALAESSDYLKALQLVRTRLLGMRRYTVRGTVHPPTEKWLSMTVEIVANGGSVLANETFYASRLAPPTAGTQPPPVPRAADATPDDASGKGETSVVSEAYQLVPLASAWLTFALHDIFRYPSDRKWRRLSRRPPSHPRLDRLVGRPGPLFLVGTNNWKSYGQFRAGYWMETLGRPKDAKRMYISALDADRHNIGAVLNNMTLDEFDGRSIDVVSLRLKMVADKIEERRGVLVDQPECWRVHRRIRGRIGSHTKAAGDTEQRGPCEQIARQVLSIPDQRPKRLALRSGSASEGFDTLSPLWFTWAYKETVAHLHRHASGVEGGDLEHANATIERLTRIMAIVLLTYEDTEHRNKVPRAQMNSTERTLVDLSRAGEFMTLSLLATSLSELELENHTVGSPMPDSRYEEIPTTERWAYLAGARPGTTALDLRTVMGLIQPERPISFGARYNLACCYSRRAEHFSNGHAPPPPRAVANPPSEFDPDSFEFPEVLVRQGRLHLRLALEKSTIADRALRDPLIEHIYHDDLLPSHAR